MRQKAKVRLICIIVAAVLAALLVPLAVRAWWFVSPTKVSSNTNGNGMYRYPALAARGSNVYAVWSRQEGSSTNQTDPYYDKSSDDGLTWGTDINIQLSPSTETYAPLDLTIDSADGVHFVWAEVAGSSPLYTYTLYYSYTIATAIQTITQTTQIALEPAVEVSSGEVHVVWSQGGKTSDIWHASKSIGLGDWSSSTFTNVHPSSSTASYHPDIAVDDNDDLHVVWEETESPYTSTILYKKRDGGGWSPDPTPLSEGITNSRRPAIAVYSDTVNVVWCEKKIDDQYVHFRQATDWGDNWSTTSELISGSPLAANQAFPTYLWPAITVDSNGKIHVAFNGGSDASSPEDIHYVSRPEGGSWSWRWNVTHNPKNATTPAIATAGDWVHLIWAQQSSGTLYDVYYSRAGILEEVKSVYLPLILKAY